MKYGWEVNPGIPLLVGIVLWTASISLNELVDFELGIHTDKPTIFDDNRLPDRDNLTRRLGEQSLVTPPLVTPAEVLMVTPTPEGFAIAHAAKVTPVPTNTP
jgi:hypothetical protein